MKVAYLISLYPAVSHTFILTEVMALRERGFDIGTFSVRQARPRDILGPAMEAEARRTRHLVPMNLFSYLAAGLWALATRPLVAARTFQWACMRLNMTLFDRLMWLFYFGEAVQLSRWIVKGGYEHLHCHFGNAGSNTAILASQLSGVTFSFSLHGIDMDEPVRFRLAEKIGMAKFVVCISRFGKAKMMLISPMQYWPKIRLVHCGYPGPVRSEAPPQSGEGRMLCTARLALEKGHGVLLEALGMLKAEGKRFHCTLVGDGPLRQELEQQVRALGLAQHVRIAGAMPMAKVQEELGKADIFVMASLAEGIPIALMEAMANCRPVVAPRVCGIPELVEHGVAGLLTLPTSARDLAAALTELLDHPERAHAMGNQAPRMVRRKFRVDIAAERMGALFRGEPLPSRGSASID